MARRRLPDIPPDKYRSFHELAVFAERWGELGLTDADKVELMARLMNDPDTGTVVPGAAPLRKVRYAPPGRGKSGGFRVYYAHFDGYGVVLLAIVFEKNEAPDVPPAVRADLVNAAERVEAGLAARRDRLRDRGDHA